MHVYCFNQENRQTRHDLCKSIDSQAFCAVVRNPLVISSLFELSSEHASGNMYGAYRYILCVCAFSLKKREKGNVYLHLFYIYSIYSRHHSDYRQIHGQGLKLSIGMDNR